MCSLLPESVRAKCAAYVDEYTPFILQVIAAEIKPKEVCSLLKLCPKTNMVKANPGGLLKIFVLTQPPPISPAVAHMDHYIVYLYRSFWVSIFFPYGKSRAKTSFTFRGHFKLCFRYFSFIFG